MRALILGTAGHVDHGKTSFIRALTGIDCDRLKEEKERGITIELGFAHLDLPNGQRLGIVDVPGHEKFVRNMVAGAAGMDLVAFIVAADEGIMPQTVEHFEICQLLGVRDGLIVLTKKDLVDAEWLAMVEEELREFFQGSFLENAPILAVNSVSGEGIEEVKAVLATKAAGIDLPEEFGPFRLPVDRVFTMKGFGTVVTGTSLSGRITTGSSLTFYPGGLNAKIRGMQVHGQSEDEVEAGHRTAINLQGVEKEQIAKGDMAATPDSMVPTILFDAEMQLLSSATKPLKHRTQVRVHLGAREIMGRISLLDGDTLKPGEQALVQLMLQEKAVAWPGDRFVVRTYSPATTVGGGRILSVAPKKRKRSNQPDREAAQGILQMYAEAEPAEILLKLLQESGYKGLDFKQLSAKSGIFGKKLQKLLERPVSTGQIVVVDSESKRMLAEEVVARIQEKISALLAAFHQDNPLKKGMRREELRSQLKPRIDARLLQHQLTVLAKKGILVQEGSEVRLAEHAVRLAVDVQAVEQKLEDLYLKAVLTPPNLKEVLALFAEIPEKEVMQVVELLETKNTLIRVNSALFFHKDALTALQEKLTTWLQEHKEIDAPAFKELTGLTRKFSIPLLEYFDRIKLTLRIGDKRILRKG